MRAYLRRVLFSLDLGIGQLMDGTYQVITAPIHALGKDT
jgi:hypothetical protein